MLRTSTHRRQLLLALPLLPAILLHPAAADPETPQKPETAAKPWPGVEFTEARAFAWPAESEPKRLVQQDKSLLPGMANKDGAPLSSEQLKRLSAAVTGTHPEYGLMRCYTPRHAIVFYDKDKKVVAFLELCLDCQSR